MSSKQKIYQIDAFTDKVYGGNPAAVCILNKWISENLMQQIAAENNLAETVFAVKENDIYNIRWFTPTVEVNLCGHATMAAAYVIFNYYGHNANSIQFMSHLSGPLSVKKDNKELTLDFPVDKLNKIDIPECLINAFGFEPIECYKGQTDFLLLFSSQQEITDCTPNFNSIANVGGRGVIITSQGNDVDFVSRFFGPQVGVNEDPVTGSAHTTLTPFWSEKLNKKTLTAKQLSKREGNLICALDNERVKITGKAVTYLIGEIEI